MDWEKRHYSPVKYSFWNSGSKIKSRGCSKEGFCISGPRKLERWQRAPKALAQQDRRAASVLRTAPSVEAPWNARDETVGGLTVAC